MVKYIQKYWDKIDYELNLSEEHPHEANLLKLDCSKARTQLKWIPIWTGRNAVEKTGARRHAHAAAHLQSLGIDGME